MNKEIPEFLKFNKISRDKKEKLIIAFLSGVFLILVSTPVNKITNKTKNEKNAGDAVSKQDEKKDINNAYLTNMENKLEQTIGGMDGAGRVLVMITLKDDGEKILDKNRPYESQSETDKADGRDYSRETIKSDQETVLVDREGDTSPIVVKEQYPGVEGVVVLCEGGNDKALSLKIKEAVGALFSVPSHKIVVGKLRSD